MIVRVLLAGLAPPVAARLRAALAGPGTNVLDLGAEEDLPARLARESADLVLLARARLGRAPAETLAAVRTAPDRPQAIVVVPEEDAEERARLLADGAYAVVCTALRERALARALRTLVARVREEALGRIGVARGGSPYRLADFVAESGAMRAFLDVVRRVVAADTSLLVVGETGVGKEYLARAVHAESARAEGPLVAVDCASLPETLLESELFGHVEGAFTGATRARRGQFELAHRGTLFLDEVGELPPHLQVKLLRALQERTVRPLGSEEGISVDVRVLAATNRDPAVEVAAGRLRSDLYYRLGVVTLRMPSLRERREDVPELARSHLERFRARLRRPDVERIRADALELLVAYAWPGNVRELVNVLERAVLLCRGPEITPADLPEEIRAARPPAPAAERPAPAAERPAPADPPAARAAGADAPRPWRDVRREALAELERRYFAELLASTGGRVGEAARRAGLDPRSLYDALRRTGLRPDRRRAPARAGERRRPAELGAG